MQIFHLHYFVAVAENLNSSRATRQLHMAISPLSRRIPDLERELGQQQFDRDFRHVALTRAGTALLPMAKDVVGRFDDLPWQLRQAKWPERRVAYVGVVPALHPRLRERLAPSSRPSGWRGCAHCSGRARIDPEAAAAVMRAAGLEPLEPYPGSDKHWGDGRGGRRSPLRGARPGHLHVQVVEGGEPGEQIGHELPLRDGASTDPRACRPSVAGRTTSTASTIIAATAFP
ncbi:LysR family transcriptional regulator [Streptomyces triculaminicus]|uniref:LysR family transcriptional regulator n=1 Tax=Streptomyces triculaminicus TaxID=2816232 RepID=UPI00340082FE